ncbi:MAG: helix-turn-helix domain-containing protein [Patescibacteria group bacterium]
MRNYNLRILKERRTYTPQEIADRLGATRGTIYRWVEEGLEPIRPDTNPLLFYGETVIAFLRKQRKSHEVKLKPDELYCLRCHEARWVDPKEVRTEKTGKKVGKDNRDQLQNVARCSDCNATMRRFIRTSPKGTNRSPPNMTI